MESWGGHEEGVVWSDYIGLAREGERRGGAKRESEGHLHLCISINCSCITYHRRTINLKQTAAMHQVHKLSYGIVIHRVPIAELGATKMTNTEAIKRFETENNMKIGTIAKITLLRHKNNHNSDSDKVKLHYSIVLYTSDRHVANRCITNSCCIQYLYYPAERFTSQYQITKCFNCCEYGD